MIRRLSYHRLGNRLGRRLRLPGAALLLLAVLFLVGCGSLKKMTSPAPVNEKDPGLALPAKNSSRVSQFVFYYDFEIKKDLPLFEELADLRDEVYKELKLPSSDKLIHVYLFEDRDRYERYMNLKYPDLPKRRAFFVAQPRSVGNSEDLMIYTFWGERVRQDLRHEMTHALLHSVLKDVPLWLDEGLAEYYEMPPDKETTIQVHLEQIHQNAGESFTPDLARLEKLTEVRQMNPTEYREAWAWVHLLLRSDPEARALLLEYLQQLRTTDKPGPLEPKLARILSAPATALDKHLRSLELQ